MTADTPSTPFYIRRDGETLKDFIVRIKASGQLPYLVEEPQPSTGRPVGRPRKSLEPAP